MNKINILIADAHTLTREGLKSLLSTKKDICICGVVKNSKELPSTIKKAKPDIVIIDSFIPPFFSIDDIAFLRKNYPEISILVISNNQNKKDILKAIDYKIDTYLFKECGEEELLKAVYASSKKEKFFCGKVMDTILENITNHHSIDFECNNCQEVPISERELEIIVLIAKSYTTKDIANRLCLSFHTVSTHRKNIFKKLKIRSSSELILYAMKNGIINP